MEDGRKDVLVVFRRVVVHEAVSVYAQCVPSHLVQFDFTLQVTSLAEHMQHHGLVPWPGQCLLCVSNLLMLLETRAVLPSRPGRLWLMPIPSQPLCEKRELKICTWHFLPTTWRQKDVTVENGWSWSYWPCCLPWCRSPCDSCNVPQLLSFSHSGVCLKNCLLCLDCVCLSFHTTAVRLPLVVTQISPCFSFWVLVFRSLGIPFLCSHSPTKVNYFSGPGHRTGQGKKEVHVQFVTNSLSDSRHICHWHGLLTGVVPSTVLAQVHIHVICRISGVS